MCPETMQMTGKHLNRCWKFLVVKEMQIITKVRDNFSPSKMRKVTENIRAKMTQIACKVV